MTSFPLSSMLYLSSANLCSRVSKLFLKSESMASVSWVMIPLIEDVMLDIVSERSA